MDHRSSLPMTFRMCIRPFHLYRGIRPMFVSCILCVRGLYQTPPSANREIRTLPCCLLPDTVVTVHIRINAVCPYPVGGHIPPYCLQSILG